MTTRTHGIHVSASPLDTVADFAAKAWNGLLGRLETGIRSMRISRGEAEPLTFFEASEGPTVLSAVEAERMWAIQRDADTDPEAYMEACRAKAR